jgi:hypothetical protein
MFLVEPTNGKTLRHVVKTSWEKMGSGKPKKIENIIQNTKTFVLVCNVTMSMFLVEAVIVITWHKVHGRKGGWRFCAKAGGL